LTVEVLKGFERSGRGQIKRWYRNEFRHTEVGQGFFYMIDGKSYHPSDAEELVRRLESDALEEIRVVESGNVHQKNNLHCAVCFEPAQAHSCGGVIHSEETGKNQEGSIVKYRCDRCFEEC